MPCVSTSLCDEHARDHGAAWAGFGYDFPPYVMRCGGLYSTQSMLLATAFFHEA